MQNIKKKTNEPILRKCCDKKQMYIQTDGQTQIHRTLAKCGSKKEAKADQSKGAKKVQRQICIKYSQEIEKEILGGNCLSDMTINLAQSTVFISNRS